MQLKILTDKEALTINGGTEETYSLGHSIGSHIRQGLSNVGRLLEIIF